jgi:hypothetical protein
MKPGKEAQYFVGTTYKHASTNITVCKIGFLMKIGGGDISGKTFLCKIWTPSANAVHAVDTSGTALATSNGVSGSTITSSAAEIDFTFSTPYTLTADTYYIITVDAGGADDTNYAMVMIQDSNAWTPKGEGAAWTSSGICSWDMRWATDIYLNNYE